MRTHFLVCVAVGLSALTAALPSLAQFRGPPPGPPLPAQRAAVIDLTGYWVALVTQDWRWRMMTAPVGDTESIPVNRAGQAAANAWDPAKDQAAGAQCKAYGAAGLMRIPTRLHIFWKDAQTLEIDTDAGQQMRQLHFSGVPQGGPSAQGYSLARWYKQLQSAGFGPPTGGPVPGKGGTLKVVTTALVPGYLRTNGVPYSDRATMTEWFDRLEDEGSIYLILTSVIQDPVYLADEYVTSYEFKREADGSKWRPQPCRIVPPRVKLPPPQAGF